MRNQKSILMLGGSMQQVPAIEKAKELGYRTVLIDYLPDNPGRIVADKWYQESTTDLDKVYEIAKNENVSGVLPYASDPAALPASIVCERLGLPSNPSRSVEILGIKSEFRKFLQNNGFACPNNFSFQSHDDIEGIIERCSELTFPIVIKPTDSSGSKGVSFLNDIVGVRHAIRFADQYSRNKILIAEEFIDRGYPYVIGGDIFVENGKIILYGDMECLRDDNGKSLIPIGKKKPNGLNDNQRALMHSELQRLVDALEIKKGELNIELIIDKKGEPYFLELGPRAGGNMIPVQLSDAFGVDLIEANIKSAMGEPINLLPRKSGDSYMTFVLHSHEDGLLENVHYSEGIRPFLYREVMYKKAGDKVEAFDGAGKAIGIVFMRFPSITKMCWAEKNIDELIKVNLK